ncbi:homoserine O-acetyltransferase [Massarina eburnea CBS 473.64]|uniref:Homoserine O-acetyltransferase n=1 Tax=Massarina eburnea CBS 473.64 TaxID=1395130 RepID=A0A6A6RQV4_9PLEO|nr:homoserine O-acetyltransferase [Massarina eburnea CBS 473.64]
MAEHDFHPIMLDHIQDDNNFYAKLVSNKKVALIPSFTLESGIILNSAPVAYSTWGALNDDRDNVLVVCHALTGSSDAMDWWHPLFGPGKALDTARYFIICLNVLGSPYGSASPLSTNPATAKQYGPRFPATTIRDDVRIHKLVLDSLGIQNVAAVIGGSMGGMTTLEWALCTPPGYVKTIIPITTSAYHGGWGISWGETQRQAIYTDAVFNNGWYEPTPEGQPRNGLGTARMIAMLTYRSHGSFESKFSRRPAQPVKNEVKMNETGLLTPSPSPRVTTTSPDTKTSSEPLSSMAFSAQSYLDYQARKFLSRFDANAYIHLTHKLDSHDITRDRIPHPPSYSPSESDLRHVLRAVPPKSLVISVETDVLFLPEQQVLLAKCLPEAQLVKLESDDGHDGFLLEFEAMNKIISEHLRERCPWIYKGKETGWGDQSVMYKGGGMNSMFGEAEKLKL